MSDCSKKPEANCLPPSCKWAKGEKRSFCRTSRNKGSNGSSRGSPCAKVERSNCTSPCKWAQGEVRQFCRIGTNRSPTGPPASSGGSRRSKKTARKGKTAVPLGRARKSKPKGMTARKSMPVDNTVDKGFIIEDIDDDFMPVKKKLSFTQEAMALKQDSIQCVRVPAKALKRGKKLLIPWEVYLENVFFNCIQKQEDPFMLENDLHNYARERAAAVGMKTTDRYDVEMSGNLNNQTASNHLCLVPRGTFTLESRVHFALAFVKYMNEDDMNLHNSYIITKMKKFLNK